MNGSDHVLQMSQLLTEVSKSFAEVNKDRNSIPNQNHRQKKSLHKGNHTSWHNITHYLNTKTKFTVCFNLKNPEPTDA